MMTVVDYMLLDVFTDRVFCGNPLAVVADAGEIADETMQAVARELNLSETVFIGRDDAAAASLRIFTPSREMPFAGHPTVGAAIALAERLRWERCTGDAFTLRLPIGNVPIAVERAGATIAWLTTPPVTFGRRIDRDEAAAILSVGPADVRGDLPPQLAGAGRPFLYVALSSAEAVDRALLDAAHVRSHVGWDELNGVFLFAQTQNGAYARMFAPMSGIGEDPATGSAAGPMYAYLDCHGALPQSERFVTEQGVAMGRPSRIEIRVQRGDGDLAVQVGGSAVFVGDGRLRVPAG